MKVASASRYDVSAMLISGAGTLKSRAIVGSAVARTVASRFSMNIAQATINAIVR